MKNDKPVHHIDTEAKRNQEQLPIEDFRLTIEKRNLWAQRLRKVALDDFKVKVFTETGTQLIADSG